MSTKKRPVKLIKLSTGRICEAESISAFCKANRYTKNEKCHFTPILNNERWMYKGWVLPETYDALTEEREWEDVYGNEYRVSVWAITKKLNEANSISPPISNFLMGVSSSIKGIYLKGVERKFLPPKNYEVEYYALIKDGKIFRGKTQEELAEETGINRRSIHNLIFGHYEKIKGYELHEIKTKKRTIL